MAPQSTHQQANTPGFANLFLPPCANNEVKPEASLSEKCDALLHVCRRASELQTEILVDSSSPRTDFTAYATVLERMRSRAQEESQTISTETPERVAVDLITLSSHYLSSQLTHDQFHYWVAFTSALTATTRTTMPALSDQFNDALSRLVSNRTQLPRKSVELDDEEED